MRRLLAAACLLVALTGCASHHKPKVSVVKPAQAVPLACAKAHGFDARKILGFSVPAARAVLRRRGCTLRVVEAGGHPLAHITDFTPGRVDVGIEKAHVVRIFGET